MNVFSVFVESMHRLRKELLVSDEKVQELFEDGKITEEEKIYILGK